MTIAFNVTDIMADDQPQDMQQGSSSSDDSDSDFEEVEASPEDMELMMQLESDLQANPNLYDFHVQVGPGPLLLHLVLRPWASCKPDTNMPCST